jgi:hypothetical protein
MPAHPEQPLKSARPYRIAISYASDQRGQLRQVVEHLLLYFSLDQIFYDELHTDQLARPNIDEWLRKVFGSEADLVVIFRSPRAGISPWWQLEENAIKSAYDEKVLDADRIMPLSFGDITNYTVNFPEAVFRNVEGMKPKSIAELILKRWERQRGQRISARPTSWKPWTTIHWHAAFAAFVWFSILVSTLYFGVQGKTGAVLTILCWLFPFVSILLGLYIGSKPSKVQWDRIIIPDRTIEPHADRDLLNAWVNYARNLEGQLNESKDAQMMIKREMAATLRHERLVARMLAWSVFLITVANCLVQLLAKHLEWRFVGENLIHPGADWKTILSSPSNYTGTLATLAASVIIVFLCSFVTERRADGRFRLAWVVGFLAPLLAGITIAGVDIVQQSSEIFPGESSVNYPLAGALVAERLIFVPLVGLGCSLLASLVQPKADEKIVRWSA